MVMGFLILTGCRARQIKSLANALNRNPKIFIHGRPNVLSIFQEILNDKILLDDENELKKSDKPFLRSLVKDNTLLKKIIVNCVKNKNQSKEIVNFSFEQFAKNSTGRPVESFNIVGSVEENAAYLTSVTRQIPNFKMIGFVCHPRHFIQAKIKNNANKRWKAMKSEKLLIQWDEMVSCIRSLNENGLLIKCEDFFKDSQASMNKVAKFLDIKEYEVPKYNQPIKMVGSLGTLEYKIRMILNKYPELDY